MDIRKTLNDFYSAEAARTNLVNLAEAYIVAGIPKEDWHKATDEDLLNNSPHLHIMGWNGLGYDTSRLTLFITQYSARKGNCDVLVESRHFPYMGDIRYSVEMKLDHPKKSPRLFSFREAEAQEIFYRVEGILDESGDKLDFDMDPAHALSDAADLAVILEYM